MTPPAQSAGVLPLDGIQVVDLTQVLAGPFATMTLGDLGANVIKIEPRGRGDRARQIQPYPEYYDTVNRNKHSVTLDLKSDAGQQVARDLLADADVFVESTKPGRIQTYGLDYEQVHAINPGIIYCSVSGFGRDSPYEHVGAWDMLIQAMSGVMSMTGHPDGPPLWSGLASGDLAAGLYVTQSVLAALLARERGDIQGEWIEVPMLDAAISLLSVRAGHTFGTGEPFPRLGTHHPSIVPFGVYECADGAIVIAAGTDSLWRDLCDAIDQPRLGADERFATLDDRVEHREAVRATLEPIIETRTTADWIDAFHAKGIPAGPIYDTKTVWDDDHVTRRQLRRTMPRPDRPDATVIDHPIHYTHLTTHLATPPQTLGESTDTILRAHGYSTESITELRETGVID